MMTTNKDNKETTVTFRLSADLKGKLQVMADKDGRSLSNLIKYLLEKAAKEKK